MKKCFLFLNITFYLIIANNVLKETVSLISSDSPCKEGNTRFTTVPLKLMCVRRVQRYVCLNLSDPVCILLNSSVRCVELKLFGSQHSAHLNNKHSSHLNNKHSAHLNNKHSAHLNNKHSVHLNNKHSAHLNNKHSAHLNNKHSAHLNNKQVSRSLHTYLCSWRTHKCLPL